MSEKKIIIRMPNWVGDAVMASPIIEDIKKHYPDASLTLLCQGQIGQLFTHNPFVDEIFSFKKQSGWVHHLHCTHVIEDIKKGEYDLGILLTNSFSSAFWFWRGKVKKIIGFKSSFRSLLLTDPIPFPVNKDGQHLVKTYKALLKPLGIPPSNTLPKLWVTEEEKEAARIGLRKAGAALHLPVQDNKGEKPFPLLPATAVSRLIGINPGAAYGHAKCWEPDRFRELTKKLINNSNYYVIYFGDNSQKQMVEEIIKDLGPQVINLAGKTTLRELMAYISLLNAMVANDSGPMHMAYAENIPVIAIFGPTSPKISGPLGSSTTVQKQPACSPCFKRVCPIDHRCMTLISADEVYNSVISHIK